MTASFSTWPRHVYIASDGRGRHKIGQTVNLKSRRYNLSRDLGRPVTIIHADPVSPDADAIECAAHWLLVERHGGREWFEVSEADARDALSTAKAQVAAGQLPEHRLVLIERYGLPALIARDVAKACGARETPREFVHLAIQAELKRRERKPKGQP